MSRDALVVGINAYKFLPGLQAPARDAEAIAQQLHTYGEFRVHRLPEVLEAGKPQVGQKTTITLRQLETALINLFRPKGNNVAQTALFYFSGHGIQREAGIQEGYLALSDSNPDKGIFGLSLFWLRRLLQESPVKQRIIILDCCHSGEFLNFLEADPGARPGTDRLFMAASREYETAYESLESPYSIFTQAILTGLDPHRVLSGIVTNHSLTDWVNHTLKGEIQQPLFESSGSEITLTRCAHGQPMAVKVQPSTDLCPYRGLEYFDETHSDYFFGREDLTTELVTKLKGDRFVAVVGDSGIGKSSLIRAGLVPYLKQRASQQWQIKLLTPGEHPLKSLGRAFIDPNLSTLERAEQLRRAETFLQDGGRLAQLVQACLPTDHSLGAVERPRMLLVIDQFEEVFTLSRGSHAERERQQFFNCLVEALEMAGNLSILIVLRSDFQPKCALYKGLAQQIEQHSIKVKPLKYEQIKATILKPAQKVGLVCEPSLVYNMLLDVIGAPGELPLLQYTLLELWKQRRIGSEGGVARLTLEAYQGLGGVSGTLQKQATGVFNSLSSEEQSVAKRIFLALTQLGEGTEDTRRRAMKSELVSLAFPVELVEQVVEKLVAAKLVITSHDGEQPFLDTQDQAGTNLKSSLVNSCTREIVDVAHETLIRNWSLLRNWLEESRDMLRRLRRIEQATQEWDSAGQPLAGEYLLQGLRLRDAEDFRQIYPHELSALSQRYVAISHEAIRRARRESRQLQIAVPAVLLMTLAAVLSQYRGAAHSPAEIDYQPQMTSAPEQAAIAQTIPRDASRDPMAALLVSQLASQPAHPSYEAQANLRSTLQNLRLQMELRGHEGAVHQLSFSPDQHRLATAGEDGTIRLWALNSQTILNMHLEPTRILSWSESGSNKASIAAIAFSPDGQQVAAIAQDSSVVKIWSVAAGAVRLQLTELAAVKQVMFSPDGNWIATAQSDRTLSIWRADTGQLQTRLSQPDDITQLQFSANGQLLLAAAANKAQLWRLTADPTQQLKLQALATLSHPGSITCASFSPSGRSIATASTDGKVRLWNTAGQLRQTLSPNGTATSAQPLTQLQFNPDESKIAVSSSQDVWLWNLQSGQFQTKFMAALPPTSEARTTAKTFLRFSPNGRFLVTGSSNGAQPNTQGAAYLWDAQTGQQVGKMQSSLMEAAEFSPDGTYIATANSQGSVQLWSAETGGELPTIALSSSGVKWSMFLPNPASPAANRLITVTPEGKLQNWQILTDAASASTPKPMAAAPVYTSAIEPQGAWQRLLALMGLHAQQPATPIAGVSSIQTGTQSPVAASASLTAVLPGSMAVTSSQITGMALSPDGQLIAVSDPAGGIEIRQVQPDQSTKLVQRIRNQRSRPEPSLSQAASGAEVKPAPAITMAATASEPLLISQMSFSPDGRLLLGIGNDLTVRLWNVQTGQLLNMFRGHTATVQQARFSPDGQQIVTASWDKTVRIWQSASGQMVKVLPHQNGVNSASFSPDGQQVVTAGSDGTARLWDMKTGQQRVVLTGHQAKVLDAQFSPDGQSLVTASADGTAIIWDVQTGLKQAQLRPNLENKLPIPLLQATFSPDGKYIATQT
ncbi:MAG TPA: caspase family protein, partial [Coleofasciculaceae cyanobacterium]